MNTKAKTAKEWAIQWSGTTTTAGTYMDDLTRIIESIQRDAREAALREAHDLVGRNNHTIGGCLTCDAQQSILSLINKEGA